MRRATFWTCRRVKHSIPCNTRNPTAKRLCVKCGLPKPARRQPTHMRALTVPYNEYVLLNGGEKCAICLRVSGPNRHLDRDHSHISGAPRGLLCSRCNRALPRWMTPEWLEAAATYLRRTT